MLTDTSSMGTFIKRGSRGETTVSRMKPNETVELYVGDVFYLAEHANRFELTEQ